MTAQRMKEITEKYCTKKNVKLIKLDEESETATIEFPNGKRTQKPVVLLEIDISFRGKQMNRHKTKVFGFMPFRRWHRLHTWTEKQLKQSQRDQDYAKSKSTFTRGV